MSKKNIPEHTLALGPKALEMVMRDVLGGMEELTLMKNYETSGGIFEVISIDPTEEIEPQHETDKSVSKKKLDKAEIIQIDEFRTQTDEKE
ncbi:MAG: hypothetical protein KAS48_06700 [Gammaproteobacteria bacterium]|nr:hypothetical protein [Gammaproteobacteria bacterium]